MSLKSVENEILRIGKQWPKVPSPKHLFPSLGKENLTCSLQTDTYTEKENRGHTLRVAGVKITFMKQILEVQTNRYYLSPCIRQSFLLKKLS